MKVLYPMYAFYPHHGGGPSTTVYWMAKALVSQGVDVTVVTTNSGLDGKFEEDAWVAVDGIRVRYCSGKGFVQDVKVIWFSLKSLKGCDVLHLESFCYLPSLVLALLVGLFTGKKIIWSPRGEVSDNFLSKSKTKRMLFKSCGFLFRHRVIFHGTSDEEVSSIKKVIGDCGIIQLPNYMELPPKIDVEQDNSLVFLGRINPVKALHKLIDALYHSDRFMTSGMVLKIVGKAVTPEEKEYLQNLHEQIGEARLDDRILFVGHVGGKEKDELLAKARYSFLVSESENFGNVVVESMAQGTPVITSLGTPWQVLQAKGIGYNVGNDVETLSKTIGVVLSVKDSEYANLRSRVYDYCIKEYDIQKKIHHWIEMYE